MNEYIKREELKPQTVAMIMKQVEIKAKVSCLGGKRGVGPWTLVCRALDKMRCNNKVLGRMEHTLISGKRLDSKTRISTRRRRQ
jgi:hypothetical protein